MTASSQNRKATSTARSTNVSSSTERNLDGTRESGLHLRHEIKDSVSHSGTLFWNGDGLFRRERTDGDMEAERQKIEARRDGKTRTVTASGIGPKGKRFHNTAIYDKA